MSSEIVNIPVFQKQKSIGKKWILFSSNNIILYTFLFLIIALIYDSLHAKETLTLVLNSYHNDVADSFFKYVTHLGHGIMYVLLAVYVWFLNRKNWLNLWAVFAIQTLVSTILKRIIFTDVPRPKKYLGSVFNELHQVSGVDIHTSHSFPSGHTMTAFSIAFFILLFIKIKLPYQYLIILTAGLVGLSRVYLLQHFLIDVVFGAFFGITVVLLIKTMKIKRFLIRKKAVLKIKLS